MRIGVLGTGSVGQALARRLVEVGHQVRMGSRRPGHEIAAAFAEEAGDRGGAGTFAEVAGWAELVVNATSGEGTLPALDACGAHLDGKVLVDVANPLDFSRGFPPTLSVVNDDSLGEQVQRAHPLARVVKSLNTMSNAVMVDPGRVPGDHVVFVSGEDPSAKDVVRELLGDLGWPAARVVDLGGIETSRGVEGWLALWVRLYGALGTGDFNIALPRGGAAPT